MRIKEYAFDKVNKSKLGRQLFGDKHTEIIVKAVASLIFNLTFAFYNAILGFTSLSLIFVASALYYFLLCVMRFCLVLFNKTKQNENKTALIIGIMLVILSTVFYIMMIISMKYKTATVYGTITMITIATFTFTKITVAVITAVKNKNNTSKFIKSVNMIRYSEVAVSLLTMQQSMLVSFGGSEEIYAAILNAATGTVVCFFILTLGIITIINSKKGEI